MPRILIAIIFCFFYFSSISQNYECNDDLEIKNFKLPYSSLYPNYNFKVVVGQELKYKLRPKEGSSWIWEMGPDSCSSFIPYPWDVISTANDSLFSHSSSEENMAMILRMPENNTDFGNTNGNIRVLIDSIYYACKNKEGKPAVAEIFYEKDTISNPGMKEPNWLYYWQQNPIIDSFLHLPDLFLFDMETCEFDKKPLAYNQRFKYDTAGVEYEYGSNNFNILNSFEKKEIGEGSNTGECTHLPKQTITVKMEDYSREINITNYCGFEKSTNHCDTSNFDKDYGIHVFYRTVAHEAEHRKIEYDVWTYTNPASNHGPGYSSLYDLESNPDPTVVRLGDGYKDSWEILSTDGKMYFFKATQFDGYQISYNDKDQSNWPNTCNFCITDSSSLGFCRPGTRYEETRCRIKESNLNLNLVDDYDWSFDPKNEVQGKNWKP